MTDEEVTREILLDYEASISSIKSEQRLVRSYDKERKKKKIRPTSEYLVYRELVSNRSNKWIVFVRKKKELKKYKSPDDISYYSIVYYYTTKGLRVFMVTESKVMMVFNGHLFSRYNERLELNKPVLLDVVKEFFLNYHHCSYQFIPNGEMRSKVIGLTYGGFLVGEAKLDQQWVICKTFISFSTAGAKLDQAEYEFIQLLRFNLQQATKAGLEKDRQFYSNLIKQSGISESPYFNSDVEIVLEPSILKKYESWMVQRM